MIKECSKIGWQLAGKNVQISKLEKNILDNDWKEWLESRKIVLCFIVFVFGVVELTDFCQFVLLAAGHG